MRPLWQRYSRLIRRSGPALLAPALSVLATVALAVQRPLGAVVVAMVTVVLWLLQRGSIRDQLTGSRAVLATALSVSYLAVAPALVGAVACAAMLLAVLADSPFRRLCPIRIEARGLPEYRSSPAALRVGPFHSVTAAWNLVMAGVLLFGVPSPWPVPVASVILLIVGAWLAFAELVADRGHADEAAVAVALARVGPRFVVYFAGSEEALYQLAMWLPYLERVDRPYAVITRNAAVLSGMRQLTSAPVLAVRRVETLERIMPDSVGAIFYVNNDARNADGVRLNGPTHVHLGHGDSEKPPSYTPTTAMFDRIFVAGQAGIDRFARHGVVVPLEKFVIVGRPQLESIRPAGTLPEEQTVLYAPTWRGGLHDMRFGSLDVGERIVEALLDLGARVVFRPHPYSARDAESRVIIGRIDAVLNARDARHVNSVAAGAMTITECFNLSTGTVTDVSSVASDYLFAGKPLAIVSPAGGAPTTLSDYPFLNACYRLDRQADFSPVLATMLGEDPLAAARAEQRRYYLGDPPPEGYASMFVDACLRAIDDPSPRRIA